MALDPVREAGKLLIVFGAVLVVFGVVLALGGKLPWRLGRLPGDLVIRRDHSTLYFPVVTCLVLSVVVSLILWLVARLRP